MKAYFCSDDESGVDLVRSHGAQPINIDGRGYIYSVAFLADGKYFVSGDEEGIIRTWRIQDSNEVGIPMDVGSSVHDIAVSQDGKWIVSGTQNGFVTVWNAESHEKVTEIEHTDDSEVDAVDVSPDGTKIPSGSREETLCVWSLLTSQQLLNPLKHDYWVVCAKFSPDRHLIATATCNRHSVRVYDSRNGHLLVNVPIKVSSDVNRSLAWVIDGKQLFTLSCNGNMHCLDPSHRTTLSKWFPGISEYTGCIALESTGMLIAVLAGSSVFFWNTTTHKQIGAVIEHKHPVYSMTISDTTDLVISGYNSITFTSLSDTLLRDNPTLCFKTVQKLRADLTDFQRKANQQKDGLCEIIRSMRADLHTEETSPSTVAFCMEAT